MQIDLLNMDDEAVYYLQQLVKSPEYREEVYFNEQIYTIYTKEYTAPTPVETEESLLDSSESSEETSLTSRAYGFFQVPINYFLQASTSSTSSSSSTDSEPLSSPAASSSQSWTIKLSIELSHHLLIKKSGVEYRCYLVDKKSFASGGFGDVFDSPGYFIINDKTDAFQFINAGNIAKYIELLFERERKRLNPQRPRINEYEHLKQIFPETEMIETRQTPKCCHKPWEEIKTYFIITPRLEGECLEKLEIKTLTVAQKFKIALSLLWEMHQLHDPALLGRQHIHNDIKPANIIVSEKNDAHYCDFGAATLEGEPVDVLTARYSRYPDFSCPAKKEADIYSLAITLFQLFFPSQHIPENRSCWDVLPKGKNKKLKNNWPDNSTHRQIVPAKILNSNRKKRAYRRIHSDITVITPSTVGLSNMQSEQLFNILKKMRNKKPISTKEAYQQLRLIADTLDDFDKNYFDENRIFESSSGAAASSSLSL